MKKTKIIIYSVLFLSLISLLTYLNYDKISNYFTNKEWEIADSVGKINFDSYLGLESTNSNFIFIDNDEIIGYSETAKKEFEHSMSSKDIETYTTEDYMILADKDTGTIEVFSGKENIWTDTISNANILEVYINKNGYSAVIYAQTGYKSLIRVFSNTGEELFTSFLPSSYAIDVAISTDNKTLAVAEVDTSGINVKSVIKFINIKDAAETGATTFNLEDGELAVNIEFIANNKFVVMTDKKVKLFDNNEFVTIVDFKTDDVLFASIDNLENVVTVRRLKEGLFDSNVELCIYEYGDNEELKKYELEEVPNAIHCFRKVTAVDVGNEIIFLNNSGNFMKKCEYNGQLKDLFVLGNENTAILIFRNCAEFIKIGGI